MWLVIGTKEKTERVPNGRQAERHYSECGEVAVFYERRAVSSLQLYFLNVVDYRSRIVMRPTTRWPTKTRRSRRASRSSRSAPASASIRSRAGPVQDRVLPALRALRAIDTEDHPGLAERVLAVVASAVSSTAVTFRHPLAATDESRGGPPARAKRAPSRHLARGRGSALAARGRRARSTGAPRRVHERPRHVKSGVESAPHVPRVHVFLVDDARTVLSSVVDHADTDPRTNKNLVASMTRRTRTFTETEVARVVAVANLVSSAVAHEARNPVAIIFNSRGGVVTLRARAEAAGEGARPARCSRLSFRSSRVPAKTDETDAYGSI